MSGLVFIVFDTAHDVRSRPQAIEEHTQEDYLAMELWKKDEFAVWKAEQEEQLKLKLASSAQHKQYRRYMKNHGPGRMYFDDS